MTTRKASIKETGEELSQADWARFDAAAAKVKAEKPTPLRDDVEKSPPRIVNEPERGHDAIKRAAAER